MLAIGTCGAIVDPTLADSWVCELCENDETLEASIVSFHTFLSLLLLNAAHRTLTASFAHELQTKTSERSLGPHPIASSGHANPQRVKDGRTSCVLSSPLS